MGAASIGAVHAQGGFAVQQNHDGIYAVDVVTRLGSCDRDYHWLIAVSGGRVSSAGDTLMEASGQISRRGIVALAFQRFGQAPRLQESSRWGQARGPGHQRRCNAPVHGGPPGKAETGKNKLAALA
jgi:hypothetical protein